MFGFKNKEKGTILSVLFLGYLYCDQYVCYFSGDFPFRVLRSGDLDDNPRPWPTKDDYNYKYKSLSDCVKFDQWYNTVKDKKLDIEFQFISAIKFFNFLDFICSVN